jgi:PKD repeat protein
MNFSHEYLNSTILSMSKKLFTTALIFTATLTASFAQQNKCGSDIVLKQQMAKNPQIAVDAEEFERGFSDWKANKPIGFREGEKYIIPVVFHIIHEGGSENISKAQIEDQLEILNKCYRHENSDSVNTPQPFLDIAGKLDIEFRLAKLDPKGNCTEGITRTFSNKTNQASDDNGIKELIDWNCYQYFNVWVVKSIGVDSDFGTILGYAQFPASGLCGTDGVVLLHNVCGSIGTASGAEGRTLVHEAGHWLSLIHIWGDDDCGSDQVNDTPAAFGPNLGICYDDFPYFPADTCDNTNPYGEMMVNYMDYSNDECQSMFTVGQCERMEYVLSGTSGNNGIRSYLWSDENQWLTGTHDDYDASACAPIANFLANKTFACTGTTINFDDNSYNGIVTGSSVERLWSFPGGNASSLTAASTNVTYDAPGVYEVTLTLTNAAGTDSETKTTYIHIAEDAPSVTADYTYFEDFESQSDFDNNWVVINPDNTTHKWEIAGNLTTPSGGGVLRVNNFGNTTTEYEEVISPSYNLSNLQAPLILKYQYSGATTTFLGDHTTPFEFTVDGDAFKVFYSTNCGASWTQIPQLALSADNLINAGLYSASYVPDAQSIWNEKQANIPAGAANSDNVKFKFVYEVGSGYGNNFYLDAVRIENTTGVEELNAMLGVQVYPNPSNGLTRISMNLPENGKLAINLVDVLGRTVANVYNGSVNSGEQVYSVDVNTIDAGIYFMQMNYNDKTTAVKLIVQ